MASIDNQVFVGNVYSFNNNVCGIFDYQSGRVEGFLETKEAFLGEGSGFSLGTNFGLGSPAGLDSGRIGFSIHFTNENPVVERSSLYKAKGEWLPQWIVGSMRFGAKLGIRAGYLSVNTNTEPIDPPYPSQILYGAESGFSIIKDFQLLRLETAGSAYVTCSYYDQSGKIDNSGVNSQVSTRINLSPVVIKLAWKRIGEKYNPDKYFFLDSMKEDVYECSVGYIKENIAIGAFGSVDNRDGLEFERKRNITGVGIQLAGWSAKGVHTKDLVEGTDAITISLGKTFSNAYFEAYWTKNNDNIQERNGNIFGVSFRYGLGPEPEKVLEGSSYTNYIKEENGPFTMLPDFRLSFKESVERLNTMNKVIRFTRSNIQYLTQNGEDRNPQQVFQLRGGDCDEQALFQLFTLKTHGYDYLYELAFVSPRMAHAFSYGKDKRTGKEYIWEYGRVFRLDFDPDCKLSGKEKMAAILSSRSYTEDWECLWAFQPTSSDYRHYNYGDLECVHEVWRNEIEISKDVVRVVPESGVRLFVGTKFEE